MRPLLTRHEARAMDVAASEMLGLPTLLLMENAGRGAAEAIRRRHAGALAHVVLVGGVGQNGGDAWVVARHLSIAGVRTSSFVVSPDGRVAAGDAAVMLEAIRLMGLDLYHVSTDLTTLERALSSATLVVDGLFGTGLARPIDGVHADVIARIVANGAPVVALDLPSGVDADDGSVLGVALRAETTLTFGAEKRGLHASPGFLLAGEVEVVSIGAPAPLDPRACVVEPSDVAACVRARSLDAHKGVAGHVLVVGGAPGTTGAALLAAHGALRAGAGLATIAARPDVRSAFDARVLEVMTRGFASIDELLALCEAKRSVVVGPGLGLDDEARALVRTLALTCATPMVLDADALTHLAEIGLESLADAPSPRVLTPHPGEAARLLRSTTDVVQRDRFGAARRIADACGHVVVLKGARTLVAAPGAPILVCDRGTPAMAVGGSGDVLAGVVAALLGSSEPRRDAAAAVYLHAVGGEIAARTDRGLLAHEIGDAIPAALAALRG